MLHKEEKIMEEKIQEVKYEAKDGQTITKCPYGDNSNVGSCGCGICPYHISNDKINKVVCCVGG
jgi:hypothetical protein